MFCVVCLLISPLVSDTSCPPLVCVPALLIVCPALIVFTCSLSPCVYSLCVPVFSLPVRLSFFHVSSVPAIPCTYWSLVADYRLSYGLRLCLSRSGYPAPWSTAVPLPVPTRTCVPVYGLPFLVPNPNSKDGLLPIPCLRVVRLDPQVILHPLQCPASAAVVPICHVTYYVALIGCRSIQLSEEAFFFLVRLKHAP